MIKRIFSLHLYDIWRIEIEKLPRLKRTFLQILRIIALSFQDFYRDQCSLRASSLTFFSLLSIVPTAAVAFGVAKGFREDGSSDLPSLNSEEFNKWRNIIEQLSKELQDSTANRLLKSI